MKTIKQIDVLKSIRKQMPAPVRCFKSKKAYKRVKCVRGEWN